jgi:hypothetical protein
MMPPYQRSGHTVNYRETIQVLQYPPGIVSADFDRPFLFRAKTGNR